MFTISLNQKAKVASMCGFASGKVNPIYEQVHIETSGSTVIISACNGVQYCSVSLEADVQEQIKFCVSAKRLAVVTTALAGDRAKFTLKEGNLIVTSGRSRLKVQTFNSKEYPDMQPIASPESRITLTVGELESMVNQASYCVASSDVRAYLCHMNWKIFEDHTVVVSATDGHRLSQISQSLTSSAGSGSYLVPTTLFQAVISQKLDLEDICEVAFQDGKASITAQNFKIVSTLGDGQYPDIERVIPTDTTSKATFDLNELSDLVKRVHAVASLEKTPVIKFHFITSGHCELTVQSSEKGNEFCESINLKDHSLSSDMTIGVNSKYLVEALSKQSGSEVMFILNTQSAIRIQSEMAKLVTLVMPIRC
ncbi:DNA polymerase III subunit beta [Shewanella sp. UCD-KL12]|uniref:DNA polymerase III subunit beta n=1 Tax=Shewanella sp. UCD-KL12 TaxID=1917163 RepID=UPI0009706D5C|nr:DNA polymerase III subunit beta [Shewanella sp. UCD-KL12]